jgi:L-glyceraldehyde 3-phosphate reductase
MISFSPLERGLLTNRYLQGVPYDSRAAKNTSTLHEEWLEPARLQRIQQSQSIALSRTQNLAQMAIAWLLHKGVSYLLVGVSSIAQLQDNLLATRNIHFSESELAKIEEIANT